MREIMTPAQVAEYLQLNTDTVYRLIRSHRNFFELLEERAEANGG